MKELSLLQQFGDINDPSVQNVLRSLDMLQDVSLKNGEYVFHENDKSNDFYIIGLGAVEVVKKISDSQPEREKTLDTLGAGDFFGEGALFDGAPRGASVRAITDCRLFKIDKLKFFELLKKNQSVGITFLSNILTVVNRRLRYANRELVTLYDVSKILGEVHTTFEEIAKKILHTIGEIIPFQRGFFMLIHDDLKAKTIASSYGYKNAFDEIYKDLPEMESVITALSTPHTRFKQYGSYLCIAVKNPSGNLSGLICISRKDGEFTRDGVRLCVSIGEQLGFVVENTLNELAAKNKDKLNNEFVSF